MRYILIVLLTLLVMSGCGIKRDNPLDPDTHDLQIPSNVGGLQGHAIRPGPYTVYVQLSWSGNNPNNTDGYYIYRSLSYNSAYAVIDTLLHTEGIDSQTYNHSSENDSSVTAGRFWYSVSAFKTYPAGNLEGRKCEPISVDVRD